MNIPRSQTNLRRGEIAAKCALCLRAARCVMPLGAHRSILLKKACTCRAWGHAMWIQCLAIIPWYAFGMKEPLMIAIRKDKCSRHRSWTNKVTKPGNKDLECRRGGLNEALHFFFFCGGNPPPWWAEFYRSRFQKEKQMEGFVFIVSGWCSFAAWVINIGSGLNPTLLYLFGKVILLLAE